MRLDTHVEISGALSLGCRPDVVVGCEVTGVFPDDGVRVHLNVFGLESATHDEIQRLRHDVRALLPYISQRELFVSLNHVASGGNGPLTAVHVAALLPWVDGVEVRNGWRLAVQNRTAECLAVAAGKAMLGVSLLAEQTADAVRTPLSWRTPGLVVGGVFGLPLLSVALLGGVLHFVHEQRFNRDLLFDLVARPAEVTRRIRELAA